MEVAGSESGGRTEKGREERGQRPTWCELCVGVCAHAQRGLTGGWCQHVDAAVITLDRDFLQTFGQDAEKKTLMRSCSC